MSSKHVLTWSSTLTSLDDCYMFVDVAKPHSLSSRSAGPSLAGLSREPDFDNISKGPTMGWISSRFDTLDCFGPFSVVDDCLLFHNFDCDWFPADCEL